MTPAHLALRQGTADAHDVVDGAFSQFDLGRADDYRRFLMSQAQVLLPLEAKLSTAEDLPHWRPRMPLLARDLAALGAVLPTPIAIEGLERPGEMHGALYVIEGSRLGGGLLARRVRPGLPREYLGATHLSGEWRTLMSAIDTAAGSEEWRAAMMAGARQIFGLYVDAARAFAPLR